MRPSVELGVIKVATFEKALVDLTRHYIMIYNIDMTNRCKGKKQKPRHRITLALDGEVWAKFQPALKERWQDSFNSWVEFAMTCYMQEDCDNCPYVDDEDKGKGYKPVGVGKNSNE